jgi:hypothetical protein
MANFFSLPKQPVIYELNTAIFLSELSKKYNRTIKLGTIPEEEWKTIAALPVDAVWLMGVWQRSPYSTKISMDNPTLKDTLPDFTEKDNMGSAYSIQAYEVEKKFGGKDGLRKARETLHSLGLGLILDYAPNHVACDHEWITKHPEYLISGTNKQFEASPGRYYKSSHGTFAYGKDPEYPPWNDVLQLNAFSGGLRKAVAKTISKIAAQCDGIRCDMAMLLTNEVFSLSWHAWVGEAPATDYWPSVIGEVRKEHPDCVFIAEVYWDWERRLLAQGFDYCYDKTLYDHLVEGTSLDIFHYIHADPLYQTRLLRFIENHDEPRAATTFKGLKHFAAAFAVATLPGAVLYHKGQLEGYKIKLPVHLGRAPSETTNNDVSSFYHTLISTVADTQMHRGVWQLRQGKNGFLRSSKLLAWEWTTNSVHFLCILNYSPDVASGRFELPSTTPPKCSLLIGDTTLTEKGVSIGEGWISTELDPWGFVLLRFGTEQPSTV